MMERIYLDHNATTPLSPEARAAMEPFLGQGGNPSSVHAEGRRARGAVDAARDRVAALLGVRPGEIVFTGGGTESCNLAIRGLARAHADKGRHLVTAATEHHAVLETVEALEKEGFETTVLPVDAAGRIDPDAFEKALRPDTIFATVMTANNETGARQPVSALAEIAAARGVLFHSDAVQSAGKEALPRRGAVAAFSLAAHKFSGPVGAGLLWLRGGLPLERIAHGGAQENARRPGTENVAAIVGLAEALARAEEYRVAEAPRQAALVEALWAELRDLPGARRNTPLDPALHLGNTLNASFGEAGLDGEELLIALDLAGLAVSSGSACLVGSIQPSHVLRAMGVADRAARATVRFSTGTGTTEAQIAETGRRVREVVARQAALHGSQGPHGASL